MDGETNLKQKDVIDAPGDSSGMFDYTLHTDEPNADLNQFHGFITPYEEEPVDMQPVKNNNLVLRGCVLRNTDSITGLVVYCGRNTKAVLNNNDSRKKVSYLERLMNRDVIWCVVILIILCIICAVASVFWERQHDDWYVPDLSHVTGADQTRAEPRSSQMTLRDAFINGFFIFLTMVILLQILIPISLYVTIEIVKLIQVRVVQGQGHPVTPVKS